MHQALKVVTLCWAGCRYHCLHHKELHYNFCLFMPLYDYLGGTVHPNTLPFHASLRKGLHTPYHTLFPSSLCSSVFQMFLLFFFLMASVNYPYIPGCCVCVSSHLKPVQIFYDYDLCRKGGRDSRLCFLGTLYWCVDIFTCPILHSHIGCLPIHCSLVSVVTVATTYPHSHCLLALWSNLFGKPIYPWSFEL